MIGQILRLVLPGVLAVSAQAADSVQSVAVPPADSHNAFYVSNREPLRPGAFAKLPLGSITPRGWLRNELLLEAGGMTGHLEEISHWCSSKNSGWADPTSPQKQGWEGTALLAQRVRRSRLRAPRSEDYRRH
jgi:hypothetical protein